jgi:hypothetical protein
MQAAPHFAKRRRALRWLVGGAGGLTLFGCGGGGEVLTGREGDRVTLAQTSATSTFNPAADFSPTANPNGVWSYGWSTDLGSSFMLDAVRGDTIFEVSGYHWWAGEKATDAEPGHFPLVSHNSTGTLLNFGGSIIVPAGQLTLHPGPDGEYAIVRFTAQVAGSYTITAAFLRLDVGCGTTTDVHVLVNNRSVFDSVVDNSCADTSMQAIETLAPGDTIDFAVGFGPGSYFCDTTGLNATITIGA